MKKKTVKMVSAVAVLAVLCGAYLGVKNYTAKQEEQEESDKDTTTSVFSASADDIKSLKFMIDKKEVTFEKKGDSWVRKDETEFPVSQDKLDEAAQALNSLEADRVLENVDDLSEYGLDAPSNMITVTTGEDEQTSFHVGMKNDSTSQYYVDKDDDTTKVYVIGADSIDPFMNSLYDYAEKEEFPSIDSSTVKKVQVEGKENSYTVEKDTDTELWNIVDGDSTEKADSAKADSLTTSLSSLAYDSFVNYKCTNDSEYGLDEPYSIITADYEEKQEVQETEDNTEEEEQEADEMVADNSESTDTEAVQKQIVIAVGDETGDDSRYVKVNDSKKIYTISEETLSALLDKSKSDFWDMTVSYVSVNDLEKLQIDYKNEVNTVSVSRETSENEDSEDETITAYDFDGKEIEEVDFTTFYNKLINMAAQDRLTEEYQPKEKPEMTITFTKTDGKRITVEYYSYDTNFYAAVTEDKVNLVNKMTVKEMITSYETLKDN